MATVVPVLKWLGKYPVLHPDHLNDLETLAGVHEFGNKMPRHEAEKKAYGDYVEDQRLSAAAHHLAGLKAAQAAGNQPAAIKHGQMYSLHSQALGHEAIGEPHKHVAARMQNIKGIANFKAHKGDYFALPPENKE